MCESKDVVISQHPLSQTMIVGTDGAVGRRSARQWLEDIALFFHVPLYYLMPLGVLVEVKGFRIVCDETASAGDYVAIPTKLEAPPIVSMRETVGAQIYI